MRFATGLERRDGWAILAAAALVNLSYPPFRLLVPSFLCLAPLVAAFEGPGSPGHHFRRGFWFGVATHLVLLHWIAVSLWRFRPAASPLFLVVVAGFGLYTGVTFALVGWIRRRTAVPLIVAFPVAWTALEWVLAHQGPIAIPWLGLGTSLSGFPVLAQAADLVGARGLTLLLAAANVALALAWRRRATPRRATLLVAGVVAGLMLASGYGSFRRRHLPLRSAGTVLLVQPNLGAEQKWDPRLQDSLVEATLALSREAAAGHRPDLIVWPEVALPVPLVQRPGWVAALARHAVEARAELMVGGVDLEAGRTYNAAFHFSPRAFAPRDPRERIYRKERLVPVFEWLNGVRRGGAGPLTATRAGAIGVLICHEVVFEELARARRRDGAAYLVNLANDAWFLGTGAPAQQAAHSVIRAIETRAAVVRVANTGPSGVVDALGRVRGWTDQNVRVAVLDTVVTSEARSLYVRWGDWVGLTSIVAAAGLVLVAAARGLITARPARPPAPPASRCTSGGFARAAPGS
jgi:apolipoprotein N-acyltransferase